MNTLLILHDPLSGCELAQGSDLAHGFSLLPKIDG
jgi:hypothetical protein